MDLGWKYTNSPDLLIMFVQFFSRLAIHACWADFKHGTDSYEVHFRGMDTVFGEMSLCPYNTWYVYNLGVPLFR